MRISAVNAKFPFLGCVLVVLILLVGASTVIAADATTATLTGRVTVSDDGTPLPGVAITATDNERGTSSRTVTDADGRFRVPALRPSVYTVTAALDGFTPFTVSGIILEVGREIAADMALQPGFEEEISVEASYQAIDPTQSQVVTNITTRQITALPLPTRNYLELAYLAPGVNPSRDVGFDGVVSAGGQEARNAFLYIDGADSNNFILGGPGSAISQDAVQEFQVITKNFLAEYGRSNSAIVNVITKSGSNQLHGSAFYYYRGESLSSDSFFPDVESDFKRDNWGLSLGGPLLSDRLFYFLSYDDLAVDVPTAVRVPARPELNESATVSDDRLLLFGRLDWAASQNSRWSLAYHYEDFAEKNVDVGGGITVSAGYSRDTTGNALTLNNYWIPGGGNTYNELRIYGYDWEQESLPNSWEPSLSYPSYTVGQNPRFPQGGTEQRIGIADSISFNLKGGHLLKAGFDYSDWDMDVHFDLFTGGQFVYVSDDPASEPFIYLLGMGDSSTTNNVDFYSFFVQDEWRPTGRLTLNFGLRADLQDGANNSDSVSPYPFIQSAGPDGWHWQPRAGFVYDLTGDSSAILRGGAGVFYSQVFNTTSLTEDIFNGVNFRIAVFPCFAVPGFCDPANPPPPEAMLGLPPDIRANASDLSIPYTNQFTLGGAFELGKSWMLQADLVYARGYHEFLEIRENLRVDATDPNSPRPHPEVGSIRRVHTAGDSEYTALLASLSKRLTNHWQLGLAYTLSKIENEAEFYAVAVGDSRADNPSLNDHGPGRQDQRHRLVANSIWYLPAGFSLSSILTYGSGQPWSQRLGFDANLDDAADQDRPAGVGRNSETSSSYFRWDLRLAWVVKLGPTELEVIAEVFNLTNHKNYDPGTYSNVVSSPDFGDPRPSSAEAYLPRQGQLAVRLSF